jgi:hypothetical protein
MTFSATGPSASMMRRTIWDCGDDEGDRDCGCSGCCCDEEGLPAVTAALSCRRGSDIDTWCFAKSSSLGEEAPTLTALISELPPLTSGDAAKLGCCGQKGRTKHAQAAEGANARGTLLSFDRLRGGVRPQGRMTAKVEP